MISLQDNATYIENISTQDNGVHATGTIDLNINPSDGDTIVLNSKTFTYRTSPSKTDDVLIGKNATASVTNLMNGALPSVATYSQSGTSITITYGTVGTIGNNYSIKCSYVSGLISNLSGGVDADGDWVKEGPTTVSYVPEMLVIDSSSTSTSLNSTNNLNQGTPLKLIDSNNNIFSNYLGPVTITQTGPWRNRPASQNLYSTTDDIHQQLTLESNHLPMVVDGHQVAVTSSRAYTFGGIDASYNTISTVASAPVDSNGNIGAWSTDNPLPRPIQDFCGCIQTLNKIYLIGGAYKDSSGNYVKLDTVISASVDSNGIIGTWATESNRLPSAIASATSIVTSTRVYIVGIYPSNKIYWAPIDTNGNIGAWTVDSNTVPANALGASFVSKNKAYVLGSSSINTPDYSWASIDSNGVLGKFTTVDSSPYIDAYASEDVAVIGNNVFVFGDSSGAIAKLIINPDGSIKIVGSTNYYTPSAYSNGGRIVVTKNNIYMIGGYDQNSDNILDTVYSTPIKGWVSDNNSKMKIFSGDISSFGINSKPVKAFLDRDITTSLCVEANSNRILNLPHINIPIDSSTAMNGGNIVTTSKIITGEELIINDVTAAIGTVSFSNPLYTATLPNHNLSTKPKKAYKKASEILTKVSSTTTQFVGTSNKTGLLTTGDTIRLDGTDVVSTNVVESGSGPYTYTIKFASQATTPNTCEIMSRNVVLTKSSETFDGTKFNIIYNNEKLQGRSFQRMIEAKHIKTKVEVPLQTQVWKL